MSWEEEVERLDAVRKKKKDNSTSEVDMQFKSINLLAEHLGESNVFAQEEISSPGSSFTSSEDDQESEFFKDIMKIKGAVEHQDSKRQNLHPIAGVVTKEMELESKRVVRNKSRQSVMSANESKLSEFKGDVFSPLSRGLTPVSSMLTPVSRVLTPDSRGFTPPELKGKATRPKATSATPTAARRSFTGLTSSHRREKQ
jgi:hypothetical protein